METRSARRRVGNLPADLTSFVGRRTDIADVKALLSTSRLVTLVGQGGIGKTRLGLRVAADLRRAFSDGVWFVELSEVGAGGIADALTDALGLQQRGADAVVDQLGGRRMLLVLDNCEHLVDETADVVALLLRSAPHLRVVATSRQPLRVSGEQVYLVSRLDVPDPRLPLAPGAATQYAAMALFVERARAVVPDFVLTAENEPAVAELCLQLEGNPLAIELAAVSLRALSVQEVADRLDRRFDVLTSGPRTATGRHQTLEASIAWSYGLCTPAERVLWARCAVFAGSFDRAAVGVVCVDDELRGAEVLDLLAGLVDKSVLQREELDQTIRFTMPESIRQYGLARLDDEGSRALVGGRHLDYFAALVREAAGELFGPRQVGWLATLRRDHANLRVALELALGSAGRPDVALELASAAWPYWVACGQLLEGRHWLDRALFADAERTAARARALWVDALLAVLQGDRAVAEEFADGALELAAATGDDESVACATHVRGLGALFAGDLGLAVTLLDEAAAGYRDLGSAGAVGMSLLVDVHLALALLFEGESARAVTVAERCRNRCLVAGERWILSYAVLVTGLAEFVRGDATATSALVSEALVAKRDLGDTLGIAVSLDVLGWVAASEGEHDRAATLLGASHRVWDTVGEPVFGSKNFAALRAQAEDAVRRGGGTDTYNDGYARGAAFDTMQAVAFALGEPEPQPVDDDGTDPVVGLTRRETQVAELVGRGLSNKEIAATLVISQRTAEGHVQRILTKFGFTSRAQVATWVAEQRPVVSG